MKKALKIIANILLWAFVALSALLTIMVFTAQNNKEGLPQIFGKSPITILSDSMKPTFQSGDLIIDQFLTPDEKASLKVDDIITFYADLDSNGEDEINTHRIVEVNEQDGYVFYTTRGDNTETNTKNDEQLIRYDMVLGKYTGKKVAGLGTVLNFLQSSTGFLVCIVLPLIVFFLFELYRFIVVIVASKNKNQLSAQQEEEIKQKAIEEYLKQKNDSEKEDK